MKTFKVKNYKGNLVESLSKFQKSHKGMKIVEACEDGDDLKIKAEESEKLEEATANNKVYVLFRNDEYHEPLAICSQLDDAKQIANSMRDEYGDEELVVEMWPLNKYVSKDDDCKSWTV